MDLSSIWPWALGAVLLLALVILILLALLLRRSAKSSQFVDAEESAEEEDSPAAPAMVEEGLVASIPDAFKRAATYIDRAADGDRKNVPLFLLMGDAGSRDSDLLGSSGLDLTWGTPAEAGTSFGEGRGFWVFDRGVVLDVAGDPIGPDKKDDRAWNTILSHLQRLRPKRPIDGVIVTLSYTELLDAAGSEVKRTELAARAARLYRKLWDAQQRLGFRLPTYVIVTGCERLTGFRTLCGSMLEQSRRQIVGWSNPNGIESVYRGAWVDEAVNALVTRIDDVGLEILAEGTGEGDHLLRLTPTLASLGTALRVTLDGLFKASAYQGTLIFRGLYFCGRETVGALDDAPPSGHVAFLAEVLDRKVFLEHKLAAPTSLTVMARNRAVTIAKTAAAALFLLAIVSVISAGFIYRGRNATLVPLLTKAAEAMESEQRGDDLKISANALLEDMAKISFEHYGSVIVPASWFSPYRPRMRTAMSDAFHDIILRAIDYELREKRTALVRDGGSLVPLVPVPPINNPAAYQLPSVFSPATMTSGAADVPGFMTMPPVQGSTATQAINAPAAWVDDRVTPIGKMPEFIQLKEYTAELKRLDGYIRIFNDLGKAGHGDLRQLGELVKYSLGMEPPPSFYKKTHLYQRALAAAQHHTLEADPANVDAAARKLNRLAEEFHDALFRRNPFAARLQHLSSSIQNVTWQPPSRGDTEPLKSISEQLKRIDADLAGPDLAWAFKREFDLGPEYDAVINDITATSYLGEPVAMQLRDATVQRWGRFQQGLTWASSPLTKTIVAVHEDHPEQHLSKESVLLQSALQTFLGQAFVSSPRQGRPPRTDLPEGLRLTWNATALDQAVGVAQAYDRFRTGTLTLFPPDVRVSIDQVARERALADMLDSLNRAQLYETIGYAGNAAALEEQLRADLTRFSSEVQPLETVMNATASLSPEAGRLVATAMSAEAYRMLSDVNRLLALERPYTTSVDLMQWDGATPPSPAVWGAEDDAALAAYLEATRGRIALLAVNYAKPLIAWLTKAQMASSPDRRELIAGWQTILDDLREHEAKRPGNSVAVLEDYVGVRMAKVSSRDCSAATLPAGFRGRGYFARTVQDLSRDVRQRCLEVAGRDATSRYALIERHFNQRLAGRYPFSDTLPRTIDQEADPADVRAFFRIFDAHKAVIAAPPAQGGLDASQDAQRRFIEEMAAVRTFFASFLDAPKPELAPSVDVEATFRVLKPREIEGDQIIGWSVGVGEQTVTNRAANKKLRWTAGEPLRLSLRWAADAPRVPVVAGQRASIVDGRTVVWEYANRWALLAALADHPTRSEELPNYDDTQPVTLAFDVSTAEAFGPKSERTPTRVFMRLAVLAPGTNQPLELPRFPSRAPGIATAVTVKEASR